MRGRFNSEPAPLHHRRDVALVAARQPGELATRRRVDEPAVRLQLFAERLRQQQTPIHPALVVAHQPPELRLRQPVLAVQRPHETR